ncbi:MAG: family 43 glycosylhydrolase [Chitinophagaceae bacterium]
MKRLHVFYLSFFFLLVANEINAQKQIHPIPAPLYRDPITDGAADPVLIWNRQEKKWWMLYTQRRANLEAPDVAYCYGNDIAIASGEDSGQTWVYRGTLKLDIEKGRNTFWAPDVVYENGVYHMFVAYIQGVRIHWGGDKHLAHYTSKNLWDWKFEGFLKLSSGMVIDPSLIKMPNGTWRMWYKDEINHSHLMLAESNDLFHWKQFPDPVLGNTAQEGPKIFNYKGYYWMLTDEWRGMRVYRSSDATHWEKQGLILDSASKRKEDGPSGAHGDVIVINDKAWIFYFTHPGRKKHTETHEGENGIVPFDERRSSIQAAALKVENGTLVCDRSENVDFLLEAPVK